MLWWQLWQVLSYEKNTRTCFFYIFHVALGGMIHSEAGPYRESHVHLQYFLMKRAIWRLMIFHLDSINYVNPEINIESDFHILCECSWQFSSCIFQATWKPNHYEQFTQRNWMNKCGSLWELNHWLCLLALFSELFRIMCSSLSDP